MYTISDALYAWVHSANRTIFDFQRKMPATGLCSIQRQEIQTVPRNPRMTERLKRKLDRFESMR